MTRPRNEGFSKHDIEHVDLRTRDFLSRELDRDAGLHGGKVEKRKPNPALPVDKSDITVQRTFDWDARQNAEIYQPFPKVDPAKVDTEIAQAIGSLGAPRYDDRLAAETTLKAGGLRSLPGLREAQQSLDPHVRAMAKDLENHIELRSLLSGSVDALAEREEIYGKKRPADWPERFEQLTNFADTKVDASMLHHQLERMRQDPRCAGSLALADREALEAMRTRTRLDYAEALLQPGQTQDIPKAIDLLKTSVERGLVDPADSQFLTLAKQAGAFDNEEFRRSFLEHGGDVTDAGGKFKSPEEAEQYYRRRIAALSGGQKPDGPPEDKAHSTARRTLTQRLIGTLHAEGKDDEARRLQDQLTREDAANKDRQIP